MTPPRLGATSGAAPDVPEDLGELLTTRGGGLREVLVHIIYGAMLACCGLMPIGIALRWILQPTSTLPGAKPTGSLFGTILFGVVGLFLLWLAYYQASKPWSKFYFHEFGARRTIFGRTRAVVRYDQAQSFAYNVIRKYVNGLYTGTTVELVLVRLPVDGRKGEKLKYSGIHREKPDGVLSRTFLSRNFKGEDELDAIKNIIALAIAQRWLQSPDFRIPWGGNAILTPAGLAFERGSNKGRTFPYANAGALGPYESGNYRRLALTDALPHGFILLRPSDTNFWPGLMVVEMMQEEEDITPSDV